MDFKPINSATSQLLINCYMILRIFYNKRYPLLYFTAHMFITSRESTSKVDNFAYKRSPTGMPTFNFLLSRSEITRYRL